ncbi:dTDP-4-dehydrorhamnose reductase family protein [Pseudoalteromonas fenneropenaei]|uniref:dTDP-4-dehydrorhamnose reductase n=1 Tax=Pseudoalteromonas fenneropenaei TaxID=1737459 RepID=A0ABV7CPA3_9GAMM
MSILITGATGLLGRAIYAQCQAQFPTLDIIGTGFSRAQAPLVQLDLNDAAAVRAFFAKYQPSVVIHAAAERKPDVCENDPEQTLALNVETSRLLAELCHEQQSRLFFISTDYVFDGKNAPYAENATPNPLNFYGKSKMMAEQAIVAINPSHTIIRVPVLYGEVEYLAESAVTVIAQQIQQNPQSSHDHWAVRYPTHVADVAQTIADLIALPAAQSAGIFHVSDSQAMTKYDMACVIAAALGQNASSLVAVPEPTQSAARPYNCALKDTRLKQLGIVHSRKFDVAIQQIITRS